MKQILIELKESIFKKKVFSLLILLLSILFFLLISITFLQFLNVNTKSKSFYAQFNGQNIYQLSDTLVDEKEQAFFRDPSSLSRIKVFYNELHSSNKFKYFNTTLQPIGIQNFKGNETFLEGYEYGYSEEPYEKNIGKAKYDFVKSIQLSKNIFSFAKLKLKEGSFFKEKDYIYKENEKIPVILGGQYSNIYKVGDTIKIDYIDKDLDGKIIGILKDDSMIPAREDTEFYLDRYIILPEFTIKKLPKNNSSDLTFQQRHYLHLIGGQILSSKDNLQIRKVLQQISKKTGFNDFTVIGANGVGLELVSSIMNQSLNIIVLLLVLVFTFCIISIVITFNIKWNVNMRKYSVHLISGATPNKIYKYMLFEVFFVLSISLLVVFLFMNTIGVMPWFYYLIMVFTGLIISLLGLTPLYLKLKKLNISELLKGKE
ncbi:ABC transporter permease [Bacillus inaquosorum]|uniref:ABC transporter permease n=1 Tax=Bacillus inaquosorum TaxID=483913 RepID=UPI00227DED3A|nr:ABC transporter permease [Bacillus inaquosorum]MCY8029140.1 ABC transporter permease [Bacillus inaquosorum]MCY8870347.1 ABC transporter permease [Bacillus inaquosorum]MCY9095174.1 ABC transporter permease [Bacillus inaquosorum]